MCSLLHGTMVKKATDADAGKLCAQTNTIEQPKSTKTCLLINKRRSSTCYYCGIAYLFVIVSLPGCGERTREGRNSLLKIRRRSKHHHSSSMNPHVYK